MSRSLPAAYDFSEIAVGVNIMIRDWNQYRKQLTNAVSELAVLSPETVRAYSALSAAGQHKDVLGARTRELIALAVAVTLRCDGCIATHTEAARRYGATDDELAESLGVATAVNAGATIVYSTRVMDAAAQRPEAR